MQKKEDAVARPYMERVQEVKSTHHQAKGRESSASLARDWDWRLLASNGLYDLFISFRPCTGTTKSAHRGIGRITGIGDIRLRCLQRTGGVGYAILRDVILDEELEEILFSYQVVMGKGYKLQGEEKVV